MAVTNGPDKSFTVSRQPALPKNNMTRCRGKHVARLEMTDAWTAAWTSSGISFGSTDQQRRLLTPHNKEGDTGFPVPPCVFEDAGGSTAFVAISTFFPVSRLSTSFQIDTRNCYWYRATRGVTFRYLSEFLRIVPVVPISSFRLSSFRRFRRSRPPPPTLVEARTSLAGRLSPRTRYQNYLLQRDLQTLFLKLFLHLCRLRTLSGGSRQHLK